MANSWVPHNIVGHVYYIYEVYIGSIYSTRFGTDLIVECRHVVCFGVTINDGCMELRQQVILYLGIL